MTEGERLTRLEERYAHLQQHVAAQDKAMLELGEELARVRRELAALRARMAAGGGSVDEPEGGPPPHY